MGRCFKQGARRHSADALAQMDRKPLTRIFQGAKSVSSRSCQNSWQWLATLRPATSRHLLLSRTRDWIPLPGLGGAMKPRQPREAMPLTVWIAFALMAIGTVVYLTGFLIIDDILAFLGAKK